ncbi:MAG: hypothetical protein ACI4TM_12020 [Candidatus Cryptobacteroides sp.]
MNFKIRYIAFVAAALAAVPFFTSANIVVADGAFLKPLQQRDSVLIADQLLYGVKMDKVQEGTGFAFPDFSKEFCEGVEVVSGWHLDTVKTIKGKKDRPAEMDIVAGIRITSFDEGEYLLPPISLVRRLPDGTVDTLVFKQEKVEFKTMPVDTSTFELHAQKGQIRYPVTFKEMLPYIGGVILLAAIVVLAVWLIRRYRRKVSGAGTSSEPAHIVALRKLDGLRGDKFWAPDKQKLFYSGVTDALREYMAARYGVSALESTTKEIFDALKDKDMPEDLYKELRELFERADFVKFAKYVASEDENMHTIPLAVRFVTQTYQEQLESDSSAEDDNKAPEMKKEDGNVL